MKLNYMPPPQEFKKILSARFILTMASSPPEQQKIKMFLYAQHVSEGERGEHVSEEKRGGGEVRERKGERGGEGEGEG